MAFDKAKIKREKAEISVYLELLAQQRETAAFEADADALDALNRHSHCSEDFLPKTKPIDSFSRT
jgi:hypothetical protein